MPFGYFVELWDDVEVPYELKSSLPRGELYFAFSSNDVQLVRRALDAYCKDHGIVTFRSWTNRGP